MDKKITYQKYAHAIYSLTSQEQTTDQILGDLEMVAEKFNESPSFYKHLQYPKMTLAEKEKNLQSVFGDFVSKKVYKIILLLAKNKHLNWLDKIIAEIKKIKKVNENIIDASIYTPLALEEEQKAKLKSILQDKTGKQIIIHEIIKPEIIGGIKINLAGSIIDGSIAGQIQRLKQTIKNIG